MRSSNKIITAGCLLLTSVAVCVQIVQDRTLEHSIRETLIAHATLVWLALNMLDTFSARSLVLNFFLLFSLCCLQQSTQPPRWLPLAKHCPNHPRSSSNSSREKVRVREHYYFHTSHISSPVMDMKGKMTIRENDCFHSLHTSFCVIMIQNVRMREGYHLNYEQMVEKQHYWM